MEDITVYIANYVATVNSDNSLSKIVRLTHYMAPPYTYLPYQLYYVVVHAALATVV